MNSRKTAYGNTVTGTYELILDRLDFDDRRSTLLDVPCGTGIFLDRVRELFPTVDTHGWDIAPPSTVTHKFSTVDLDRPETIRSQKMFDVITCISGVMEFSNTLAFFRSIAQILAETGTLFVTNDNLLTVRDRFLYLLSGRFRQYRLSLPLDAPT